MLSIVSRSPPSGSSAASHTKLLRVHSSVAMYRFPLLRALARSDWNLLGQLTELSLVHEEPDHEVLGHIQFPGDATHWSRRIASASWDNVDAFFHSPAVVAMMASARIHNAIA